MSRAVGQLTPLKGFCRALNFHGGKRVQHAVYGHVLQASTVERCPKLGCDSCMDVHSMVPQEECLLMNQKCEVIRDVLYQRQL